MLRCVDNITGTDGELLDRFCDSIDPRQGATRHLLAASQMWLALSVAGTSPISRVYIVEPLDPAPTPGSIGEQMQQTQPNVDGPEYLRLVRTRLGKLTSFGVEEEFLVRALRDTFEQQSNTLTDVGTAAKQRAEHRDQFLRMLEDPEAIRSFQEDIAKRDPEAAALHIDQMADRIRDMAESRLIAAPDADEAASRWADVEHWRARATEYLSDDTLEEWSRLAMFRHLG